MSIALHGPWPAPYSPQGNGGAPGATAHQQQLAGTAHTVSTRRFIKEAQAALSGIAASSGAGMPSSSASAVQELRGLLDNTARAIAGTSDAGGRLYAYLTEDALVQQLHDSVDRVRQMLVVMVHGRCSDQLATAARDAAQRLTSSRCALPLVQSRMIDGFKSLCKPFDPTREVPDRLQKQAEQLVQEAVREVYGAFWNSEMLERELSQLEQAAAQVDPQRQRAAAAAVKLLASALMSLSGDEDGGDNDSEPDLSIGGAGPCGAGGDDLFSLPAFAPAGSALMTTPQARQLTITLYEEDASGMLRSPKQLPHLNVVEHLHQLQLQAAARQEAAIRGSPLGNGAGPASHPLVITQQEDHLSTQTQTESQFYKQQPIAQPQQHHHHQQQQSLQLQQQPRQAEVRQQQQQQQQEQQEPPSSSEQAGAVEPAVEATMLLDEFLARNSSGGGAGAPHAQPSISGTPGGANSSSGAAAVNARFASSVTAASRGSSGGALGGPVFHAHMRLSPEGVEKVASFLEGTGRVRGLSLAHNWIGDSGTKRLCEAVRVNRSLRTLELPDNRITDDGAADVALLLHGNARLTTLSLACNRIGDVGAALIAQALECNSTLESLVLNENEITSAGCQALIGALRVNRTLRHLEFLPGNCAAPSDVKALARAVKRNRKFSIMHLFGGKRCI